MQHARTGEESIENVHEKSEIKFWGSVLDKKKTFNWFLNTREHNSLKCSYKHDNVVLIPQFEWYVLD
jgi:hypothetical protein